MSGSVDAFSFRDIDASQLGFVRICDISKKRHYGRRFQVLYMDSATELTVISNSLKFSKIVRRIKRISREEVDLANLQEIKAFLKTLEDVEMDARMAFSSRGCVYKVLTNIQRFFKSESHIEKIQKIKAIVQSKINEEATDNIDIDERMAEIKQLIHFPDVEQALLDLISDCINANQLNDALEISGCLIDYKKSDVEFAKIAHAFLERGELAKAAYAVERISYKSQSKIEIVQSIVMAHLTHEQPDLKAALKAISFIAPIEMNLEVIESLRRMVIECSSEDLYNPDYDETIIG